MILWQVGAAMRDLYTRLFGPGGLPTTHPLLDPEEETVRELRTSLRERQADDFAVRMLRTAAQARAHSSTWRGP